MTFFTWFYFNPFLTNPQNIYITNKEERNSRTSQPTVFSSLSSYMIYIVNIMTNQGKFSRFFFHIPIWQYSAQPA